MECDEASQTADLTELSEVSVEDEVELPFTIPTAAGASIAGVGKLASLPEAAATEGARLESNRGRPSKSAA